MFKKIIAVFTAAVLFTSCAVFGKEEPKESDSEKGNRIAKEVGQNVLTAIQNKDADALADLFCQYTVDGYGDDLKSEIQNLYDFIDGEIISHDEIETRASFDKRTEYGPVIYSYQAIYENVMTDKGTDYSISCKGYTIYKDHPELVGFVTLYVYDMDKSKYIIERDTTGNIDDSEFSYHIGALPEKDLV